jgi:flavin-binding protein dodecin
MANSVYRATELIGVSDQCGRPPPLSPSKTAGRTVRDLRVAEVLREDLTIENGKVTSYRSA